MSLRAFSLSALSLSLLLAACDGGGSTELLTDVPTAGSPDAPAVVTKGKVPGSAVDTGSEEAPAAAIVGTWTYTEAATEVHNERVGTIVFKNDGTGRFTIVEQGERDDVLTLTWRKNGTEYSAVLKDVEGEEYQAVLVITGKKLKLSLVGFEADREFTRVD